MTAVPARLTRYAAAVAAVALSAIVLFGGAPDAISAETKAAAAPQALLLVPADIVTVDTGTVAQGVKVTGTLEPRNRTSVNARIGAVIDDVLVREGERVRKGQVLLRQDSANARAQLRQAEANLESAKVEFQLSEELDKRKTELYEKKYLSEIDWATAKGETEVRRAHVHVQEAAVAIARRAVDDTAILAPISGIVAERFVQPGTNVMAGQALLTLVDLTELEFAASIPARDINQVKVGSAVTFTVDGQPGRVFRGKVVRINPMASGGSRAITLYAAIPNNDGALRGGMFASGRIVTGDAASKALRIPHATVRTIDGKQQVWVIRGGKLVQQPVVLGIRDAGTGLVEVKQGLAAGEQVVITDIGRRTPGMPVSVADPR